MPVSRYLEARKCFENTTSQQFEIFVKFSLNISLNSPEIFIYLFSNQSDFKHCLGVE